MDAEKLIHDLLNGSLYYVRKSAAENLQNISPSTPDIVAALVVAQEDVHPAVRESATFALQAAAHQQVRDTQADTVYGIAEQFRKTRTQPVKLLTFQEVEAIQRETLQQRSKVLLLYTLLPALFHGARWIGIVVPALIPHLIAVIGIGLLIYWMVRTNPKPPTKQMLYWIFESVLFGGMWWWSFFSIESWVYVLIIGSSFFTLALEPA